MPQDVRERLERALEPLRRHAELARAPEFNMVADAIRDVMLAVADVPLTDEEG